MINYEIIVRQLIKTHCNKWKYETLAQFNNFPFFNLSPKNIIKNKNIFKIFKLLLSKQKQN